MTAGRHVNTMSQSWGTPPKYVNAIKRFWHGHIGLDPCSNEYSIVHADTEFLLPLNDGLKEIWNCKTIYVNPPYGADRQRGTTIKDWLAKCVESHIKYDAEVIALVPVAPNTGHWKNYVFGQATAICFLYDTRLRFLENGQDTGKGAPMACCLIYWGREKERFLEHFLEYGATVDISTLHDKKIGINKKEPALEFAVEAQKLLSVSLEGTVG
ncbi:MAG: DNA N-6-adenine-methyltransferase [Prevotella sp.]|nr:DNA N-6-adenine-methyltransferase [Prevotella sp.]